MKSLPLALGAVSALLLAGQADARASINVSGSAAQTCYHSAKAKARSGAAIAQCTAVLQAR